MRTMNSGMEVLRPLGGLGVTNDVTNVTRKELVTAKIGRGKHEVCVV